MLLGRCLCSSAVAVSVLNASAGAAEPGASKHLVMLGNSMQGCGIDFPALSAGVGRRVESRASGGVMSAHKFAMLWHEAAARPKPAMAIIVFRRDNITRPSVRVTGKYGTKLDAILTDPELKRTVERIARPSPAEKDAPPQAFEEVVARSFVPHMIRVAREADVRLVLARCRGRRSAEDPDHHTEAMEDYTRRLADYLTENRVHFLDYVDLPDITADCYAGGDHLNDKGKRVWTALMIEDLRALLAGRRAPRERTRLVETR